MKLSIQLVSMAVALAGVVSANAAHGHHGRDIHHHHVARGRGVKVVTVTNTVFVNEEGIPYHTAVPKIQAQLHHNNKVEETTVTSEDEPTPKPEPPSSTREAKPTHAPKPPTVNGDPEAEFEDGKLDCDTFPDMYGAIPVPWMETGGWTGIQIGNGAGKKCEDGALCSYACPPGYSKAQWPEIQPASGESMGGLKCTNGKLYKTNSKNKALCVKGKGGVFVKNELDSTVPVCRTDYPGCENMNVPLVSTPGSLIELTSPDGDTYYHWQGKTTSAQYYVNPAGTPVEEGCVWGPIGGGVGNWSPMIFGAGYHKGINWLSISQNQLFDGPLNFNVKIVAGPNSKLNGNCKYENGQFSGGAPGEKGCTAALISGTAHFVLY